MTPEFDTRTMEEKASFRLRGLYKSRGYQPYRMSKFEEYDLYVRNKSFLVSDNIITFTDTNGKLMALKPDVTLSIVKNSKDLDGDVKKVYYNENVYRPARGSRSFREIMQAGLECIGAVDTYSILEVLALAKQSLAVLSDDYVLDISHLGILSCVIDRLNVTDDVRRKLLHFIGEKNFHDLYALCREEGVEESALDPLRLLLAGGRSISETCEMLAGLYADGEWKKTVDSFTSILNVLDTDRVRLDFSVVNDMTYYNGIVFQGFINGIPNSILSGGQYDLLMKKMGSSAGAIGFAVYLDQLELLTESDDGYDADVLLLYDDTTPLGLVHEKMQKLTESGKVVAARRTIPGKMKCRTTLDLTDGDKK